MLKHYLYLAILLRVFHVRNFIFISVANKTNKTKNDTVPKEEHFCDWVKALLRLGKSARKS